MTFTEDHYRVLAHIMRYNRWVHDYRVERFTTSMGLGRTTTDQMLEDLEEAGAIQGRLADGKKGKYIRGRAQKRELIAPPEALPLDEQMSRVSHVLTMCRAAPCWTDEDDAELLAVIDRLVGRTHAMGV